MYVLESQLAIAGKLLTGLGQLLSTLRVVRYRNGPLANSNVTGSKPKSNYIGISSSPSHVVIPHAFGVDGEFITHFQVRILSDEVSTPNLRLESEMVPIACLLNVRQTRYAKSYNCADSTICPTFDPSLDGEHLQHTRKKKVALVDSLRSIPYGALRLRSHLWPRRLAGRKDLLMATSTLHRGKS